MKKKGAPKGQKWLIDEDKLKQKLHWAFDPIANPLELIECTGYCAIDMDGLEKLIGECRVFFAEDLEGKIKKLYLPPSLRGMSTKPISLVRGRKRPYRNKEEIP